MDQRHHVLQLIAKAERPTRLVEAAARPKTACERLVNEPAVYQHIDGGIGRLDVHCAKSPVPILPHAFERAVRYCRSAKATRQRVSVIAVSAYAKREGDCALF